MSFVKSFDDSRAEIRFDESKPQQAQQQQDGADEKDLDKKSIALTTSEEPLNYNEKPEIIRDDASTSTKQREFKCLQHEITQCECCKNGGTPITPASTFIQPTKGDIFHLTSANEPPNDPPNSSVPGLIEPSKISLREILISNFDPKFASKIGVKDFVPAQVMNNIDKDKDLDFIPFEEIDHSYPK